MTAMMNMIKKSITEGRATAEDENETMRGDF